MANLLYRLGGAAARRRWLVLGAWVAVLVAAAVGAATLSKPTSSAITIPGTESQRAIELLAKEFPGTGGASARIVVAAPPGHTLTEPAYTVLASDALATLAKAPQVISVTGTTAFNNDVSDKLSGALTPFLILIVVLALILLLLVFRSILVPVKAALGFLLSLGASMGVVTLVFQEGHLSGLFGVEATGPILSFLPVLVIGILFGLAMDYEVFLVARIKEAHSHHGDARRAIGDGMRDSARVVTAAGLIMAAVFTAFIFGGEATIKAIGLALAVGVVVDAFIVRMTLVPAVLHLLGESAWWLPRWLQRTLPNVDIEGTGLVKPGSPRASGPLLHPHSEPVADEDVTAEHPARAEQHR